MFVFLILFVFLVSESPRYYISRNQYSKARDVFKRIARTNRREIFTATLEGENSLNLLSSSISSQPPSSSNRCVLLCRRSLYDRILIAAVVYLCFAIDIVFFAISFGINQLRGDIYMNGILMGVSGLLSPVPISFLMNKIGRKKSLLLTWFLATSGCVVYHFVSNYDWAAYLTILVARFGAGGIFQILFLYTSEAFPSEVRGTVFGISSATSKVGALVAPLVSSLIH